MAITNTIGLARNGQELKTALRLAPHDPHVLIDAGQESLLRGEWTVGWAFQLAACALQLSVGPGLYWWVSVDCMCAWVGSAEAERSGLRVAV